MRLGTKTEVLLGDEVSVVEMEELRPLILEGQDRGFLTIEQIAASLQEVEVTKEQVLDLHAYLVEQGIDILSADGKPVTVDARLTTEVVDADRASGKAADAYEDKAVLKAGKAK